MKTWTYYEVRTGDHLHLETLRLNEAQGFVRQRYEDTGEIARIFSVEREAVDHTRKDA